MQFILLSVLALAAPFFLWFPEKIFGVPYILEESVKLFLVAYFPTNLTLNRKIILALCLGVLFSLSEQVLYIFNLNNFGQALFFKRLFTVGFMHSLTFIIIAISGHRNKRGLIFGFIIASLIHFFFNGYITLAL